MKKPSITPRFLTIEQAAEYTGLSRQWFEKHRYKKTGPPYIKFARAVRYDIIDLDAYLKKHRVGM